MPQEHESTEFTVCHLAHNGLQKEHGKEAVPLRVGSLPPKLLQEQPENAASLAELKPWPLFVSL